MIVQKYSLISRSHCNFFLMMYVKDKLYEPLSIVILDDSWNASLTQYNSRWICCIEGGSSKITASMFEEH